MGTEPPANRGESPLYNEVPFSSDLGDWSMSDERAFIENLLCQRFNFLFIFFGLMLAGAVATDSRFLFCSLLLIGAGITAALAATLARSQMKLDYILDARLHADGSEHPAREVDLACNNLKPGSMRKWIGRYIPPICSIVLGCGFVLGLLGWIGPP